MASMQNAMLRNLRRFVEHHLVGVVDWKDVSLSIPHEHEGNVVQVQLDVGGRYHTVRVESPDFNTSCPNGRVLLDAREMGPIDDASWIKAASLIRTRSNGRQPEPDGAAIR